MVAGYLTDKCIRQISQMKCSSHEEVKTLDNIYIFFLISNETYIHHEKNAK